MKLEVLEKNCYYHIYNRGNNSELLFNSEENKSYFMKLVAKYFHQKIAVYAYCLMDNHFHFVVKILDDDKKITQSFSNLFNAYAKAFNKQNHRTGSLFEKHFKRIRIDNEDYLRNVIQYVHLNPQYHLKVDFQNFKFSSYKSYFSEKSTRIWKDEVILLFGGIENFIYVHEYKKLEILEQFKLE